MARAKKTPFPSWQTQKPDGIETRYIRLGNSQLISGAMQSLNHATFRIYVYMLLESAGKKEFEFSYSKYKNYCSKGGFQKAVAELEGKGFVKVVQHNKNLRIKNIYQFSDEWKKYIPP